MKDLADSGIIYIKDILDDNNTFYQFEELQLKYNISINFLTYYGLLHAIPHEFITKLNTNTPAHPNINHILSIDKVPKFIYGQLIKKKTNFPEKSYRWHQETLQINITRETFISMAVSNNRCLLNNKFKDFQFRLTHNALVTNIHLKKWNIQNDDNCTFCQNFQETVLHILIECQYSAKIWELLFEYIGEVSGVFIRPSKEEIILGVHEMLYPIFIIAY